MKVGKVKNCSTRSHVCRNHTRTCCLPIAERNTARVWGALPLLIGTNAHQPNTRLRITPVQETGSQWPGWFSPAPAASDQVRPAVPCHITPTAALVLRKARHPRRCPLKPQSLGGHAAWQAGFGAATGDCCCLPTVHDSCAASGDLMSVASLAGLVRRRRAKARLEGGSGADWPVSCPERLSCQGSAPPRSTAIRKPQEDGLPFFQPRPRWPRCGWTGRCELASIEREHTTRLMAVALEN
ncbi:hypothetical protein N658DRAFT_168962 [Parathielavia hyrcaniae]|uniref:Uncharacterized protein n=1 Tax=Parathielavia hyrcaniae TaxID=113614 RepID=A0AAN6T091_9PEZI|nr:hypothetical protein N658DRAFT_168962 [Parathielavia hyrcaniae]